MTIKKKVDEKDSSLDSLRYQVISNGGDVRQNAEEDVEWILISLRIPKDMLARIGKAVRKRPGLTRTAWMLESMQEKLGDKYE